MSNKYNFYILDLDGTVYVDGKPIEDIISQLNQLFLEGCTIIFLTNNTSIDKVIYVQKLIDLGLKFVKPINIITPIDIFIEYCKSKNIKNAYYLLPKLVVDNIEIISGPLQENDNPEIVLVGFDKELTYSKLQRASEFINSGIPYYITHIDYACPSTLGPIPDCGAIASTILHTTEVEPRNHFGKPGELMANHIRAILDDANNLNNNAVLIGDRYYTDIKLGSILKIDTVHVNTGEKNKLPEIDHKPTYEFENISEFIRWQYTSK
jgi:4-nitrophenyl phosphatase